MGVVDGLSDYTEYFQEQIDYYGTCVEKKEKLYIYTRGNFSVPKGIYTIKGTLNVPAGLPIDFNGSMLKHEPSDECNCINILHDDDFGYNINGILNNVVIEGNENSIYGVYGEDMSFNCQISKVTATNCKTGIYVHGGVTTKIFDNISSSNREYGIYMENPSNAKIENNRIEYNGKSGFYGTNITEFAFVGGFKFRDNVCQSNTECGAEFYNVTDGVIQRNDFERNKGIDALKVYGRYIQTEEEDINIGVNITDDNRFMTDDVVEGSNAISIYDIKDPIITSNSFDGKFENGINIARIQKDTNNLINDGNMVYGDITPVKTVGE